MHLEYKMQRPFGILEVKSYVVRGFWHVQFHFVNHPTLSHWCSWRQVITQPDLNGMKTEVSLFPQPPDIDNNWLYNNIHIPSAAETRIWLQWSNKHEAWCYLASAGFWGRYCSDTTGDLDVASWFSCWTGSDKLRTSNTNTLPFCSPA